MSFRQPFEIKWNAIAACALATLSIGLASSVVAAEADGPGIIEIYEQYDIVGERTATVEEINTSGIRLRNAIIATLNNMRREHEFNKDISSVVLDDIRIGDLLADANNALKAAGLTPLEPESCNNSTHECKNT